MTTILAEIPSWSQLATALGIALVGLLAGVVFEFLVMRRLRRIASRTRWAMDEIVVSALRGVTLLWLVVFGLRTAMAGLPLTESFADDARSVLRVVVIFSLTVVGARMGASSLRHYAIRTEGVLPATSILTNLFRVFAFIVGGLMILQTLGIQVAPVLTAFGIGGLAVALAAQPTLANLFAGLQILLARQMKVGDYIEFDAGKQGYVADITWRTTTLRTLTDNMVIIPNAKLADAVITNYNLPENALSVRVPVGVHYDSDLERVERVTLEVATETQAETEGASRDWQPRVRFQAFGQSSIDFVVTLRATAPEHQFLIVHEFIKRLNARYAQEGIEIPYPIRNLYFRTPLNRHDIEGSR